MDLMYLGWPLWAVLLIAQNASFTWVSRARNSGSLGYHAVASIFSNGVWFVNNAYLTLNIVDIMRWGKWDEILPLGLFYTACTIIGSVGMHWLSLRWLEVGKRRVGAGAN